MVTKFLNIDTDNTLSANSNERVPSQKAVKTYTDNLTSAKQNKVLDTPITVGSTEETTVEGALGAINTSLSNKQNQSLSSAITVDGTQQTTVEGTLNALNIYANSKQNNLTAGDNITINNNVISAKDTTYIAGTGIAITEDSDENLVISNTQTSAEWGNISGTLSNQTDLQNALNAKQDIITDLNTIRSGAEAGSTAVQPDDLAAVATTGNYTDLINKPTIPTKTSDLTNDSGFITGITSSDVTTALGYTPYNSTNPDGYTTNIGTVTSVNNTQPDSSGNVNINIPTPATVDQTYDSTSTNAQSGTAVAEAISTKQDTLVSGTNIKTVNGNSLLGSGNLDIDALPSQTGQSGKFLTTDGTDASWANVDALPSQTGQSGKFLTTDGSAASWAEIPTEVDNKSVTLNSNDEIQTVGVIDQNNPTKAIKKWTGTKAEYDAIVTKDPDTEYITTDENETVYQNSYRIGQVLPSILPISDYGLHLLDGAVIDGTGIYSSFYSYIAGLVSTYPNLFISEADWQTAVTTYGVCGKFVYDSTNQTIRLPKITGIIEGTTDVTALGDLVQAGLPNITGGMSPTGLAGVSLSYGAFYDEMSNVTDYNAGTREGYGVRWGFNAARSSSIYGNSNTVQPQTIKVYYYIVIANSYQTPTGVQISKVATDLNGKVNLNSSWGFPTGQYIDLTLGASGTTYTAPADGYVAVAKLSTANLQNITIDSNGWRAFVWANAADINIFTWLPVKKGADYQVYYNLGGATAYFRFYYAQKDNN